MQVRHHQHEHIFNISHRAQESRKTKDIRVTLSIFNFGRPRNVERIVAAASEFTLISEILVWDVSTEKDMQPNISSEKAWVIRTPGTHTREKWGLLTRYKQCLLAQNEWVLVQDDDELLGEDAVIALVKAKQLDPDRIYCYYGRDIGKGSTVDDLRYRPEDTPPMQQTAICLTKSMLTDRRFCMAAIEKAPLMEDWARKGEPYWNGEDIWHSLTAIHRTGKMHVALPIETVTYSTLPSPGAISVTGTGFDHLAFRQMFLQQGVERLGLNASSLHLHPWKQAE